MKKFIDIINEISLKINGKPADTISRPTKAEIALAANNAEKLMVIDRPQYNFLRKTGLINCFKQAPGSTSFIPGNGNIFPTPTGDSIAIGGLAYTNYWAEAYTQSSARPGLVSAIQFKIATSGGMSGPMNGTFAAYIVKPSKLNISNATSNPAFPDGVPDMNNILATSTNSYTVVNDVATEDGTSFAPGYVAMSFNFAPYCLGIGQKVYMVIAFAATAYNGRNFSTEMCVTSTPSNDSWVWVDNNVPARSYVGAVFPNLTTQLGSYFMLLTVNNAVYNYRDVSLPSDCRMPIRAGIPGSNFLFLPVDASQAMWKEFSCPIMTFYESGVDVNGNKTITFNLNYNYTIETQPLVQNFNPPANPYLLVDYIVSAGEMVNDTDVPVIPQDFIDGIVFKALRLLYSDNNGLPLDPTECERMFMRIMEKMNSILLPQRSVAVSIKSGVFTSTLAPVRGSVNANSIYNSIWPNGWANMYFMAYGNGVTSIG